MNAAAVKCAACGGHLEEGFLLDRTYGAYVPAEWVEGEPETSVWFGTKVRGKEKHRVQAFCCARCGRIELYAARDD